MVGGENNSKARMGNKNNEWKMLSQMPRLKWT